jgi:hypothetical protein
VSQWWGDMKEGWQTFTNKKEREESMRLIAQYGDNGIGRNSALLFGSLFGTASDFIQDPEETFSTYNQEIAKPFITNTMGIKENSTGYKALKYIGTRTETGIGVAANLGKGLVQGSYFLGESIGTYLRSYVIEGSRSLRLFGLDDDAVYNYAINETNKDIDRIIDVGKTIPGALKSDFFTTFNAENAYNFLFNPNLSLHDSFTYGQSVANTGLLMYGTKNLATATGSKIQAGYTSLKNVTTNFMDNMGSQAVAAGAYGNLAGNSAINNAIASSTSRITSTAKAGLINSIGRGINKGTGNTAFKKHINRNVKDVDAMDDINSFLVNGKQTDINPFTGKKDPNRIFVIQEDGSVRAVRIGDHETRTPNNQHYHLEQWDSDGNFIKPDQSVKINNSKKR